MKENYFWIAIKKISLHQQKMNGNEPIVFWMNCSIAFKWAVMDSETISSSVDTDETVIAQIWIKIYDIITENYDVSRIMK